MGRLGLESMIEEAGQPMALIWHLQANLYPPRPEMRNAASEAIEAVRDGTPEHEVELPIGAFFKGRPTAPARSIVEELRLEAFLDAPRYDDEPVEEGPDA
jgi:hypothetical protein